jgi:hypothetical protein
MPLTIACKKMSWKALLAVAFFGLLCGCKADPLPRKRIPVPSSPAALQKGSSPMMSQRSMRPTNRRIATQAGTSGIAGMTWKMPASWRLGPRRRMRVATYIIPSQYRNRYANGECSIFYFGPNQGGGLAANLNRWKGQFRPEAGKTALTLSKTNQTTINTMKVATLEVKGTFMFSPRPMSPNKVPKPDYHMLAAIVGAPQGMVFFKCVGPHAVMQQAKPAYQSLLASFRKP